MVVLLIIGADIVPLVEYQGKATLLRKVIVRYECPSNLAKAKQPSPCELGCLLIVVSAVD
jgi:hypothetical protein